MDEATHRKLWKDTLTALEIKVNYKRPGDAPEELSRVVDALNVDELRTLAAATGPIARLEIVAMASGNDREALGFHLMNLLIQRTVMGFAAEKGLVEQPGEPIRPDEIVH